MPPSPAAHWNAIGFMSSFIFSFVIIASLSERHVMETFVILGQGHFFLTYLYQARARKIGPIYIGLYLLAGAAFLYLYSILPNPEIWTLVAAGSVFSVHFFVDEMFINRLPLTTDRRLLGAAFVILYTALLVRYGYGIDFPVLSLLIGIALSAALIVRAFRERRIEASEMFFLSGIGVLGIMFFLPDAISLVSSLAFVILFHYVRWYIYYLALFGIAEDQSRFKRYVTDVCVVNAIVVALFAIYLYTAQAHFLFYLFSPAFFFAWTILHVLFSIRIPKRKAA